jgi:hemoglobin-like flavoprotein
MGDALLGALGAALGDEWTPDVEEAWQMAYNLTAETMMEAWDDGATADVTG